MARKEASLRMCSIEQQLDLSYFPAWNASEQLAVQAGDAYQIGHVLSQRLYKATIPVAEWHCIVHDGDVRRIWSETLKNYVIEQKPAHFHFCARFYLDDKVKGGTLTQIAAAVGLEPQQVQKAGRGSNAWDNMVSYLTHIKYTNKAQYAPDRVASGGVVVQGKQLWRPYQEIYNERKSDWEQGRAVVTAKRARTDVDSLEEQILRGELTRDQILLTDELYDIYARNKRRCDDAFDVWQSRRVAKAIQAMEAGEFKLTVFYITGKSGDGKSYFSQQLIKQLQASSAEKYGKAWTVADCAASHPLDDYDGSEILLMDDLRGVSMGASDWLKLLGAETAASVSARYHNKRVACRVIIINSERDVLDFFYAAMQSKAGRDESADQFFRRIIAHVVVYRVPDDTARRVRIGEVQERDEYHLHNPNGREWNGAAALVPLHYDHTRDLQDMDYDDALQRLTDIVMGRNM